MASLVVDPERELRDAMTQYIPFEGITNLSDSAYLTRAAEFRVRAEALFQAECHRQQKHPVVTPEQAEWIGIVRHKRLRFGRSNETRGAYTCLYLPGTRTPNLLTGVVTVSADLVDRGCPVRELLLLLRHEISHAANPDHGHDTLWKTYDIAIGGDGERCDASSVTAGILGHKVEIFCPIGGYATKGANGHYFQTGQIKPTARKLRKSCLKCHRDSGTYSAHTWRRVSLRDTSDAFNGNQTSFVTHPTIQLLDPHAERRFLDTFRDEEYRPPNDIEATAQDHSQACDLCGTPPTISYDVCQVCRMIYRGR
jgi:hypothetical protein